jgi:SWI/SNF-related matrix-associated actin-dependent regulator of chromatin subfamily A3
MEPQWNPALEEQALDRIHRIGQTKPVTTVKFVIENSFEQVSILSPFHSITDDC